MLFYTPPVSPKKSKIQSIKMICSIKALVFYFSSLHIFFAVIQLLLVLPMISSNLSENTAICLITIMIALLLFTSGFLMFRGCDEDSATLITFGSILLFFVLAIRYICIYLDLVVYLRKLKSRKCSDSQARRSSNEVYRIQSPLRQAHIPFTGDF